MANYRICLNMKTLDKILHEHLVLSHNLVYRLLKEEHGYSNVIETIVDVFEQIFLSAASKSRKDFDDGKICRLCRIELGDVFPNAFFSQLEINLTWKKSGKFNLSGGYDVARARFSKENNDFFVPIKINVSADNVLDIVNEALFTLSHELLHAYEDYNRRVNGSQSLLDYLDKSPYGRAEKFYSSKNDYRHKIGFIIESLTSVETNAYVQMAATEMKRLRGEEVEPVEKAIYKTSGYIRFNSIYSILKQMAAITDKNEQDKFIKAFNSIYTNEKATTFYSIIKALEHLFNKRYNRFIIQVSKIYYDRLVNVEKVIH